MWNNVYIFFDILIFIIYNMLKVMSFYDDILCMYNFLLIMFLCSDIDKNNDFIIVYGSILDT